MTDAPHGFRVALRWKMLAAFMAVFTVVFAAISIWVFSYATNAATARLATQLNASATGGAITINPVDFQILVGTVPPEPDPTKEFGFGYPADPTYQTIARPLIALEEVVPLSEPYTYYRDPADGKLYFAASADAKDQAVDGIGFGVPVADVVDATTYALMERGLETTTDQAPYTDETGSWISSYSPIVDRSKGDTVVGAVGIDYPLSYVEQVQSDVRRGLYPILVVTYLVLLGLVLALSTLLARPLKRLTAATHRVAGGEYDLDVESIVRSRFPDEMFELAESFTQMAAKIGSRERSLTQQVQQLKVEIDDARRSEAVKEITESDFFEDLTHKAAELRRRAREAPDST